MSDVSSPSIPRRRLRENFRMDIKFISRTYNTMNLSYSYYNNPESTDDELYNLAVAVNSKINNKNSTVFGHTSDPIDSIPQVRTSVHQQPYFSAQGDFTDSPSFDSFDSPTDLTDYDLHETRRRPTRHIDDFTDEDSAMTREEELDHIKDCPRCRKIFLKMLKDRNKRHVFTEPFAQPVSQPRPVVQMSTPIPQTVAPPVTPDLPFSKEVIIVFLIGLVIIFLLDMLFGRRR
jgi:hypothetical protein